MPSMTMIVVKAAFDEAASVWFVEASDIPGLNVEATTIEELREKLPLAILDLIEAGDDEDGDRSDLDVPIELIAHASARVRRYAAA